MLLQDNNMDMVLPCFPLHPLEIVGQGFRGIRVFAALHAHLITVVAQRERQAANAAAWISGLGASRIIGFFGLIDRRRLGAKLKGDGDGVGECLGSATEEGRGGVVGADPLVAAMGEAVREAMVEVAGGGGRKGGGVIGGIAEDATTDVVCKGTQHEATVSSKRTRHEALFGGEWDGHKSLIGSEGIGEGPEKQGMGWRGMKEKVVELSKEAVEERVSLEGRRRREVESGVDGLVRLATQLRPRTDEGRSQTCYRWMGEERHRKRCQMREIERGNSGERESNRVGEREWEREREIERARETERGVRREKERERGRVGRESGREAGSRGKAGR